MMNTIKDKIQARATYSSGRTISLCKCVEDKIELVGFDADTSIRHTEF